MRKIGSILIIATVMLFAMNAMAQNKVVVIPLMKSDPNLVPENICFGVTILGVKGTTLCTPTVTSTTGQIWMDRNLGASRVATSSADAEAYGDLYQWGRLADGHQSRTSSRTSALSPTYAPGHGNFIFVLSPPYDWRDQQSDNLWQGVSGTNNPCPVGFRLPTDAEWEIERASWLPNNAAGAFASPLKLVLAGFRDRYYDTLPSAGSLGSYWSSTVNGSGSRGLNFLGGINDNAYFGSFSRAYGLSVRCLKD